jgi:hypothetical protein
MKVKLSKDRKAIIGCRIGKEEPRLLRPLAPGVRATGRPFRSVKLTLTVVEKEKDEGKKKKKKKKNTVEVGVIEGTSWCNPLDQFCRKTGRLYAMRRLFARNRQVRLLDREECQKVSAAILGTNDE